MSARRTSGADDVERLLEQQRREIARLEEALARAETQRREVERERDRLKRQNERLKDHLDAARRAGFRQAAPFRKARPQGRNGRPGRRAGAAYGCRGRRGRPPRVDARHRAALPSTCPDCGGPLACTRVAAQFQEDLPVVQPIVRQFDVEVGACLHCGRRVQGRHPWQTSDALGAAQVHLGPGVVAFIVLMHTHFGVPLAKIGAVLRTQFGLTVTAGALAQLLHRTARRAAPTYETLCAQVRGSPVVTPDETGWRIGARPAWLWVFATPDTTVYAIRPGRSFADAVTVLGADFAGVLVRDGWAAYRPFTAALHQSCVAHLLRRCATLTTDHPRSPWAPAVAAVLHDALALRDRRDAEALSEHGVAVARGHLLSGMAALIDTAPAWPDAQRFARHLQTEWTALFAFLWAPDIDATNWRAEQAIRPAVVTRKVCGGNRTPRGAETQEILATVVQTARQRELDLAETITTLLRTPAVSPLAVFERRPQ